jgi:hypothetical protein
MDTKEIIILALLGVGGYFLWKNSRDQKQRRYADSLRPGSRGGAPGHDAAQGGYSGKHQIAYAITTVGGRALAEGAKAAKLGPVRYGAHEHRKAGIQMAAATGTSGLA